MKNSINNIKLKFLPIFLVSIIFVGCEDWLTVEPKGVVSPTNVTQLGEILIGNYDYLYSTRSTMTMDDDFSVNNEVYGAFSEIDRNAYRWEPIYGPGDRDLDYKDYYAQIYNANYVLELIDGAPLNGETVSRRDNVKAEALTIRGYAYLQMVNIYGAHYNASTAAADMAIPLVLSTQPIQLPRSSVADIYDQIESDLLTSLELYSDNLVNDVRTESTRPGALGLLARMYLYKGDWNKALTYATEALESYNTLYNYNDYTKSTSEDVRVALSNENIESVFFRRGSNGYSKGSNVFTVNSDLLTLFDSNDLRYDFFIEADGNGNYIYAPINTQNTTPLTGIQTPELYLIKAESYARLGNITEAMDALASLRANRLDRNAFSTQQSFDNAVRLSASNNTEAIQLVVEERRRELMFQSLRWYDMKRYVELDEYNPTITRTVEGQTYSLKKGSDQWVVDISPDNKDFNPLL